MLQGDIQQQEAVVGIAVRIRLKAQSFSCLMCGIDVPQGTYVLEKVANK